MVTLPFRNAALTWFTEERPEELWSTQLRYVAYGVETCPTTQRLHLQMWASMHKPQRLSAWKKIFPGAHVEVMRGTFEQNDKYCEKESSLVKIGDRPNENGKKTVVLQFKERIENGERVEDIADSPETFGTYLQYRNGFEAYKRHCRDKAVRHDRTQPDVYVRIGQAGAGKTRWLDDTFGLDTWRFAPDNSGRWFDGCDCDIIVFDDVDSHSVPSLSLWKRLNDRYPLPVPVKGGFITWKPKVIVWTSNHDIFEWWPDLTDEDRQAIVRRIKEIIYI